MPHAADYHCKGGQGGGTWLSLTPRAAAMSRSAARTPRHSGRMRRNSCPRGPGGSVTSSASASTEYFPAVQPHSTTVSSRRCLPGLARWNDMHDGPNADWCGAGVRGRRTCMPRAPVQQCGCWSTADVPPHENPVTRFWIRYQLSLSELHPSRFSFSVFIRYTRAFFFHIFFYAYDTLVRQDLTLSAGPVETGSAAHP